MKRRRERERGGRGGLVEKEKGKKEKREQNESEIMRGPGDLPQEDKISLTKFITTPASF